MDRSFPYTIEDVEGEALRRIRAIVMAFPDVAEQADNANSFRVRGRNFVVYWPNWFSNPRPSVWCKAPPGTQDEMIAADSERFFRPYWMRRHGWVGVWLDPPPLPDDWTELAGMFEVAYRMTAPKRLSSQLDESR